MSQLVLLTGIKNESVSIKTLADHLQSNFPSFNELWMDPNKKSRAVVLFDKTLELKDIKKQLENFEVCKFIEEAHPTDCVFVKTYESIKFGVTDKLKYLFTSHKFGGSQVLQVEQLNSEDNDCFKIVLLSWDAVLKTCKQTWKGYNWNLSVTPYFKCFIEPFETQKHRLFVLNNVALQMEMVKGTNIVPSKKPCSSSIVKNVNKTPLQQLPPQPSLAENTKAEQHSTPSLIQSEPKNEKKNLLHEFPNATLDTVGQHPHSPQEQSNNNSLIQYTKLAEVETGLEFRRLFLKHQCILMLLDLLKFEKSAKAHFKTTKLKIVKEKWEIEITGPTSSVKDIQQLLTQADNLHLSEIVTEFLALGKIQKDLELFVTSENLTIEIITARNKLYLDVFSGEDKKTSFHEFLTSLVVLKECLQLPSEQSQEDIKWNDYIERFESTHSDHHIFVSGQQVILASLAHKTENINDIINEINSEIFQFKTEAISYNKSNLSSVQDTECLEKTLKECMTSGNSSQTSESTIHLQPVSKTVSKTKTIIAFQESTLLWMLKVLNFSSAALHIFGQLFVEINEDDMEIIVSGTQQDVEVIVSAINKERKEFSLPERKQELLNDISVKEHLMAYFREFSCHIVLSENFDIFVAHSNREKMQFTNFVTNLIEYNEFDWPERYYNTKEWVKVVSAIKQSQPYLCFVTLNGKMYLLNVAIGKIVVDIDYFVRMIYETISSLTSTMVPDEMVGPCTSNPHKDQKLLANDNFKENELSFSIPDSDKISKYKCNISCKIPVLPLILQTLKFKEAVSSIGVNVKFSQNNLIISGSEEVVMDIKRIIVALDNEKSFENFYEEIGDEAYTVYTEAHQFVVSGLQDLDASIALGNNKDLVIEIRSGEKVLLRNLFTDIIKIRSYSITPEIAKLKTDQDNKKNKMYFIHVVEKYAYILTFTNEVSAENCQLQNIFKSTSSSSIDYDSDISDCSDWHDLVINCEKMKKEYCCHILQEEIDSISLPYGNYRAKIETEESGFKITSTSRTMNMNIEGKLNEILSKINICDHTFKFPGLQTYLKSEGSKIFDDLCRKNKCLFDITDTTGLDYHQSSLKKKMSSENANVEYKVILLGTAKCNGFNVHLVEGHLQDLNIEMKIELKSSEDVDECDLKRRMKSSKDLIIHLPPWLPKTTTSMDDLKASFEEKLVLVFEQAKAIKETLIAICVNHRSQSTTNPFPTDVIAKTIVEKLFENFHCSSNTENAKSYDIYICTERNEAVFKAFKFFLNLKNTSFGQPNQDCWDRVSELKGNGGYTNLHSKEVVVDVQSHYPPHKGGNACFFYPIHTTMEVMSCPAVKDPLFHEPSLKPFIFSQQNKNPDGLLASEILSLQGCNSGRIAFFYSCPDWDMYAKKNIENILQKCIERASRYDELYIVPPGMYQMPKYPGAYLAQIWFKKLESLLQKQKVLLQKKKITFIVPDPAYKKRFENEQQRRIPKQIAKDHSSHKASAIKGLKEITSQVSDTIVYFWTSSPKDFHAVEKILEDHLKQLMEKNTDTFQINQEDAEDIQNMIHTNVFSDVQITYTELLKEVKENKKRKKENKLYTFNVKIQGLEKTYVNACKDALFHRNKMDEKNVDRAHTKFSITSDQLKMTASSKAENKESKEDSNLPISTKVSDTKSLQASVTSRPFEWLYEPNKGYVFNNFDKMVGAEIEVAYFQEKKNNFKPNSQKIHNVDFNKMAATMSNSDTKDIIRREVLNPDPVQVKIPDDWTHFEGKKFKLITLSSETNEFQEFKKELELLSKLHIEEICAIDCDFATWRV